MTDRQTCTKDALGFFFLTMGCVILFDFYGYIGWVFGSTLFLGIAFFGLFLGAVVELGKTWT